MYSLARKYVVTTESHKTRFTIIDSQIEASFVSPPYHRHTKSHFQYLDYNWQQAVRPTVAVTTVNTAIEKKLTSGLLLSCPLARSHKVN